MPFNSSADVAAGLAALLKLQSPDDLAAYYTDSGGIIDQSILAAYWEIVGRLRRRGFRLAEEILLWDRAAEVERDVALFWCLQRSGAYGALDPLTVRALDRREELDTILVTVAGEWVQPASGQPGTVTTSGPLANDPSAQFNRDGSDALDQGIQW